MLKVGQEVMIRKDLGEFDWNNIHPKMLELTGRKDVVKRIQSGLLGWIYYLENSPWAWTEDMLQPIKSDILEKKQDNVNHPSHYQNGGKETIETIKDTLATGFNSYLEGNIIKYISRYKFKNGVEDLKKAQFHLNRLIKEVEGK